MNNENVVDFFDALEFWFFTFAAVCLGGFLAVEDLETYKIFSQFSTPGVYFFLFCSTLAGLIAWRLKRYAKKIS